MHIYLNNVCSSSHHMLKLTSIQLKLFDPPQKQPHINPTQWASSFRSTPSFQRSSRNAKASTWSTRDCLEVSSGMGVHFMALHCWSILTIISSSKRKPSAAEALWGHPPYEADIWSALQSRVPWPLIKAIKLDLNDPHYGPCSHRRYLRRTLKVSIIPPKLGLRLLVPSCSYKLGTNLYI